MAPAFFSQYRRGMRRLVGLVKLEIWPFKRPNTVLVSCLLASCMISSPLRVQHRTVGTSGSREQTTQPRVKAMLPNTHTYAHTHTKTPLFMQMNMHPNFKYTKHKSPCVDCAWTPGICLEPVNFTTYIALFLDLAALIKPVRPPRFLK